MKTVKLHLIVSLFTLLQVASLQAVIHEVYPDSGLSIQATVLAASNGDSVIIHDGEYTESVVVYGRGLFIGSEFIRDGDSTHIANTIIHADTTRQDTTSCFVYAYSEHPRSKLFGLTLTNGRGTYSVVSDRIAGGGVYIYDSSIQIESCVIKHCSAFMGGGIAIRGRESHPEIQMIIDCVIDSCIVDLAGGGIHANRCSLFVEGSQLSYNFCGNSGAGAFVIYSYTFLSECKILSNNGYLTGGLTYGNNRGVIENCSFLNNDCYQSEFAHMDVSDSEVVIRGCYFGATAMNDYSIVLYDLGDSFCFIGNIIENNSMTIPGTSGVVMFVQTDGIFAYNIVRNNQLLDGRVLYALSHSTVDIHHNLIENNTSYNPEMPSVLFAINEAQPSLDSNIIRGNSGQTVLYDWWEPRVVDARNNWWGHESGPYHPTLNSAGQGDTIYSNMVDFIPWLTEPPDTTMPSSIDHDADYPPIPGTWHIMNLFPNPFNSEFTIVLAGFTRTDFSIKLYDILGREAAVVHEGALTGGPLTFVAPANLASGVYFLRAVDHSHMDTRKVVFLK